jgi:hypothetical protein
MIRAVGEMALKRSPGWSGRDKPSVPAAKYAVENAFGERSEVEKKVFLRSGVA